MTVEGSPQQILLDGDANSFASMSLTSENITVNLIDSTVLTNVVTDTPVQRRSIGFD